ncbi:MAG: type II secretion system protein N [Armatimonadota bacterium]|nr:type II secretion system protein N [Armatimonadota bacterium]
MKLDKADTPKYIVIGALVAILVGYTVYQFTGKKAAAGPPAPAPVVQEEAVPVDSNATQETVSVTEKSQQAVKVALLPPQITPKRDPFVPRILPEAPDTWKPPVMTKPTQMASLPSLPSGSQSGLFGLKPVPISMGTSGSAAPNVQVDAAPRFTLTGVISGQRSVAIIRSGESERHIVREGQLINGRYLVKSIGRDRVVLTYGNRSIYLKLGGGNNAS